MQHQTTIQYGDDVLFSVGMSQNEFSVEARFLLAAKLYELGKLTSGQAARLCDKARVDFLLLRATCGRRIPTTRSAS